jgi:UDP-glucuronate decarboxylase
VYGDPLVVPQAETYLGNVNSIGPRACYDEGKRMAETLCFDYARCHQVSIAVARIFNTYGPRMNPDDGRVVTNFIAQALRGEPLTLYGDGMQTRSFCYVDDLVDGLIALMNSRSQGPVNLGNPQEITVATLARRVIEMVDPSLHVIHQQRPQDDPERRKPDITRAHSWLDWQPSVPLGFWIRANNQLFTLCSRGLHFYCGLVKLLFSYDTLHLLYWCRLCRRALYGRSG